MLPKIDTPIYEVKLISTGKVVQFRPFLVKEQKLFLMNTENDDVEATIKVIRQVLKNCVLSDIDIDALPVFDLEYLFMHLRARSVSEIVKLKYRCNNNIKDDKGEEKDCGTINEISFNVLEIQPTITEGHTKKFQLTDKVGIIMRYPTFELMQKSAGREDSDVIMDLIYASIEQVYDEDTVYHMKDSTRDEIIEFVDNLQQKDLENIRNFFDTMPKIEKKIDYMKALKIEENRLRKRLNKVVETRRRVARSTRSQSRSGTREAAPSVARSRWRVSSSWRRGSGGSTSSSRRSSAPARADRPPG